MNVNPDDESGITIKKIFDNASVESDQAQKAAITIQVMLYVSYLFYKKS